MVSTDQASGVDGRRLRSERSRQAIIDAAMALMEAGVLVPTAQQIAEQAGVGIRSFFRHFDDMEALYRAVDNEVRGYYEGFFIGKDRTGTLAERILHAAECHAEAYENIKHIILTTTAQTWRSAHLRQNYARNQRKLRKDLDVWIPELEALPDSLREAVDAVASFEMWHRLREHQGLGKKASVDVVVELLSRLLAEK